MKKEKKKKKKHLEKRKMHLWLQQILCADTYKDNTYEHDSFIYISCLCHLNISILKRKENVFAGKCLLRNYTFSLVLNVTEYF